MNISSTGGKRGKNCLRVSNFRAGGKKKPGGGGTCIGDMNVASSKDSEITEAGPKEWELENGVADLFSCETSWLGRRVLAPRTPSVNMARVIRNVLRFNTGKILRFPQKSANWPIPI